jgi:hypothetical protein
MATDVKTLQATAETLLQSVVSKAQSFQDSYLLSHGRFAQCVQTPGPVPIDSAKLPTDNTAKPYYQTESWNALGFTLPASSEVSVRIDTYAGTKGKDWCAVASFAANGSTYSKSIAGKGSEALTTDWVIAPRVIPVDVAKP